MEDIERRDLRNILIFNIAYLSLFLIFFLSIESYSRTIPIIIYFLFILAIIHASKKIHLSKYIYLSLTTAAVLNIIGPIVVIDGISLYHYWLIPGLIKFDFLLHFISIFTITLIAYNILFPYIDKKINHGWPLITILVLIASGLGSLNEIVEFIFTLTIQEASYYVGDYNNNATDLIVNFCAAIASSIFINLKHREFKPKIKVFN